MKAEFVLKNPIPSLGSDDELRVSTDLDSHPEVIYLMRSFQRFLAMIGVDDEVVSDIFNPELELEQSLEYSPEAAEEKSSPEEAFEPQDSYVEKKVQDEESFREFQKSVYNSDEFARDVFRVFLTDLIEDGDE